MVLSGAEALAGSKLFHALRTIDLADNPLGDRGLQSMLRSGAFERVRKLVLWDVGVTDVSVRELARWPRLSLVEELDLSGTGISASLRRRIAALRAGTIRPS